MTPRGLDRRFVVLIAVGLLLPGRGLRGEASAQSPPAQRASAATSSPAPSFAVSAAATAHPRDTGALAAFDAWEWETAPHPIVLPSAYQSDQGRPSIAGATALSAVVPGAGQYYLGQQRAWVYLALEAVGLYVWVDRRRAGSDLRDGYRDFAWEEARLQVEPRRDGDFDYYETMSKWDRSGAFDTDASAPGIQPETDPETFNASIWLLASRLFLGAPGAPDQAAMNRALEYYTERAYPTDQLWSWDGSPGGRARFGELIEESDQRFRQATNVLGAVIANHLVSAIDAFASARGFGEAVDVRFAPSIEPAGVRWHAGVRVGIR